MTNEQKTEAPERVDIWIQGLIRELRNEGYLVPYPIMSKAVQEGGSLIQAAVAATVRACAEAILHDHTKPDDNRLWGDERPYICEESAYRTILALEPDAQQALDKLLGEKDAEIARMREALVPFSQMPFGTGGIRCDVSVDDILKARAALEGE